MRISDWSSDVCSSDLLLALQRPRSLGEGGVEDGARRRRHQAEGPLPVGLVVARVVARQRRHVGEVAPAGGPVGAEMEPLVGVAEAVQEMHLLEGLRAVVRSEEHTSELQSLMRISYAVFCLKKKK